jgi:hypothetical protein
MQKQTATVAAKNLKQILRVVASPPGGLNCNTNNNKTPKDRSCGSHLFVFLAQTLRTPTVCNLPPATLPSFGVLRRFLGTIATTPQPPRRHVNVDIVLRNDDSGTFGEFCKARGGTTGAENGIILPAKPQTHSPDQFWMCRRSSKFSQRFL